MNIVIGQSYVLTHDHGFYLRDFGPRQTWPKDTVVTVEACNRHGYYWVRSGLVRAVIHTRDMDAVSPDTWARQSLLA